MARKRVDAAQAAAPPPTPTVHRIDPDAVYLADQAQMFLHLRASTIRREFREGRLRISKRGGRYYILGAWLLDWIRAGELPRRTPPGN